MLHVVSMRKQLSVPKTRDKLMHYFQETAADDAGGLADAGRGKLALVLNERIKPFVAYRMSRGAGSTAWRARTARPYRPCCGQFGFGLIASADRQLL